ncbi:MAG TPA: pyridoxamine 5'-phosphate oxidase, partial [Cyanothece sp. UBA12306]|nr:pyridoxamine 5'-phosphate oxidase [Cyanothece sp. UBA12306]
MDISALREEYTRNGLSRDNLNIDPFQQFEKWFKQACEADLPVP